MDRAALRGTAAAVWNFASAPPYTKKTLVEQQIDDILNAMEADGREPDAWEAQMLCTALGYITTTFYLAAAGYVDKALTEEDQRVEAGPPDTKAPTIRQLRKGLEYVQRQAAPAA